MSLAHKGGSSTSFKEGYQHPQWKGNKVGYDALHDWVYKKLGAPMICEKCGKVCKTNHEIHWANRSRKYKRIKDDWLRLCVPCHKNYDSQINKYK